MIDVILVPHKSQLAIVVIDVILYQLQLTMIVIDIEILLLIR
jgi:hypothetical protein